MSTSVLNLAVKKYKITMKSVIMTTPNVVLRVRDPPVVCIHRSRQHSSDHSHSLTPGSSKRRRVCCCCRLLLSLFFFFFFFSHIVPFLPSIKGGAAEDAGGEGADNGLSPWPLEGVSGPHQVHRRGPIQGRGGPHRPP